MTEWSRIPDRRAYRQGPDAYSNQTEADLTAAKGIPQDTLQLYGTGTHGFCMSDPAAAFNPVANFVYFFAVQPPERCIKPVAVRAWVGVVGEWAEVGLYELVRETKKFNLLPNTYAKLNCTAINLATAPLPKDAQIRPNKDPYWLGIRVDGVAWPPVSLAAYLTTGWACFNSQLVTAYPVAQRFPQTLEMQPIIGAPWGVINTPIVLYIAEPYNTMF